MSADDVDIVDLFLQALRGERNDIHTAFPGQVTAYDASTQLADVQPMLKIPQFDPETGIRIVGGGLPLPVLPKIPVMWARAGGYMMVMPLRVGDFVWISFSEAGTGEFLQSGQLSEPFDVSRHQITYPTCTPGYYPLAKKITDASVTGHAMMVMGQEGGPQIQNDGSHIIFSPTGTTADPGDAPALASVVDDILSAFSHWTPVAMDGGAALKAQLTTYLGTITTSKSTLIKCK